MAQCKGDKDSSGVALRISADPCPLAYGFSTGTHVTELENSRATKLYSVDIYTKTLGDLTEFARTSTDLTTDDHISYHHRVISAANPQPFKQIDTPSLRVKAGVANTTDEIETSAKFYDETQKTKQEELVTSYELPIP
jgi:hypothetical protein